jgi:hypothetical protein
LVETRRLLSLTRDVVAGDALEALGPPNPREMLEGLDAPEVQQVQEAGEAPEAQKA